MALPYQLTQERRDEVDIYGKFNSEDDDNGAVVIELDKWRSNQIAKKFVSRFALTLERPLIYIALCYGGTPHMNKNECSKYLIIVIVYAILLHNIIYGLRSGFTVTY